MSQFLLQGVLNSGQGQGSRFFKTQPSLWTPSQLTTSAWWDASDSSTITHSGGFVSQWRDKSGNNKHFAQATGSFQPKTGTRTIGGLNVIDMDGINDVMTCGAVIDVIGKEIWSVLVPDAFSPTGNNFMVFINGGGGNVQASGVTTTGKMRIWKATNPYSADTYSTSSMTIGQAGVFGWLTHNTTKKYSFNGTLQTTTDTYVSGSLTCNSLGKGQFSYADGGMGEIILVSSATSTSDRQKIEGYLAHKWDLENLLPASHPYRYIPPYV